VKKASSVYLHSLLKSMIVKLVCLNCLTY